MKLADESCRAFVDALGSKSPVPGGGGAAALAGAAGAALGTMVGSLTVGKEKYKEVEEEMRRLTEQAKALEKELLELVDRDAEVFAPLAEAYSMPASTEEEKRIKEEVMEKALETACSVPLAIMENCCRAIVLQEGFAEKGSRLAVSDAGVGAAFCKAALEGASLNVFINTAAMKNRGKAAELDARAEAMLSEYRGRADRVFSLVRDALKKAGDAY